MIKPKVSIVTPSYNQAQYLESTILSVLDQNYPNLEYFIIDGGSTDGSVEIIQQYNQHLDWWVSEPDQGQADAINKGFRKSSGEFIAWLNSDDLYLPGAISQAVDVFLNHPEVDVVYGDAVSADRHGRLLNELRFKDWEAVDFLQFKIICQPAVFIRRSAAEQVGFLDTSYHFFLDHQFWIRLAREHNFHHQPAFWAVSRYHPDAKNITMAVESGSEVFRILDWAANQPDLSAVINQNYAQVWAGAHAIRGRYLLDGGKPAAAFKSYSKAAASWFPSLKGFWHRYLFAGLSSLGLGFLGKWYYSLKERKRPAMAKDRSLADWPGIQID